MKRVLPRTSDVVPMLQHSRGAREHKLKTNPSLEPLLALSLEQLEHFELGHTEDAEEEKLGDVHLGVLGKVLVQGTAIVH